MNTNDSEIEVVVEPSKYDAGIEAVRAFLTGILLLFGFAFAAMLAVGPLYHSVVRGFWPTLPGLTFGQLLIFCLIGAIIGIPGVAALLGGTILTWKSIRDTAFPAFYIAFASLSIIFSLFVSLVLTGKVVFWI